MSLLWQEYKAEHPDGIQYSQFCERYRAFRQGVDHRLDEQATNDTLELPLPADHDNVRGPSCFH